MPSPERPHSPAYVEALQWVESAGGDMTIPYALGAARQHLGMDAAYVTTVDPRQQTVNAVIGDTSALGLITGTEFPAEQTYCHRMLAGQMPNVVGNTRTEPAVQDLAATENIGAYIGVPVTLSDGSVHGTLCAASREPRDDLGEDELRFFTVLADIVAKRLEAGKPGAKAATGGALPVPEH